MKNGNGNGIRLASAVIIVLLGVLIFVLTDFRNSAAEAKQKAEIVQVDLGKHEARIQVMESNLKDIRESLREIKQTLAEDRRERRRSSQ